MIDVSSPQNSGFCEVHQVAIDGGAIESEVLDVGGDVCVTECGLHLAQHRQNCEPRRRHAQATVVDEIAHGLSVILASLLHGEATLLDSFGSDNSRSELARCSH